MSKKSPSKKRLGIFADPPTKSRGDVVLTEGSPCNPLPFLSTLKEQGRLEEFLNLYDGE